MIKPLLATKWKASKNGLSWTFTLRHGVRFQDGTKFNAAAVCYNFNRWYGFPNPLQNSGVSYYWNTVFGGFAHPAPGNPGPSKSLYKGCKAKGQYTAIIQLRRRSSSFIGALALTNFGIASPTALRKYKANAGTVDSSGVFHPTGSYATRHPTGTGPYKFSSWSVGNRLVLVRNKLYWGKRAHLDRVIFRPIADNAARLQALQTGEVQGYDLVDPADVKTIKNNKSLKLLSRPAFNVGYVGINQTIPPMNKLAVRQAVAYGLDRSLVVRAFYAGRGVVANQFLPNQVVGFARKGVPAYSYNPDEGQGAAAAGRPEAAGADHVLVPDERLAAVHAEPAGERPGVRREPREVRLQGHVQVGAVAAGLPGRRPDRPRRRSTCSAGRATSVTRPTS